MFLDTVNHPTIIIAERKPATPATLLAAAPHRAWEHFPHSCITHHGRACCDTARAWALAMDDSQLTGESVFTGPRWLRARYDWGPSAHPIHWCEAVGRKTLDCGALAALAIECFRERGVTAFPAQFVQRYSHDATQHWEGRWTDDGVSTHWLSDDVIYHEGCAVLLPGGTLGLWDASAAWWLNPAQTAGYGSLAAVKISTAGAVKNALPWGPHSIPADSWVAF